MKEEKHSYIKGLLHGIGTLLTGMKVTGREFFTPKVTEQYPENRATLKISPRFRGRLIMPVDENGNNKCIACGLCQMACPNDTITITSESVTNEETGKKKKILVKYEYPVYADVDPAPCISFTKSPLVPHRHPATNLASITLPGTVHFLIPSLHRIAYIFTLYKRI